MNISPVSCYRPDQQSCNKIYENSSLLCWCKKMHLDYSNGEQKFITVRATLVKDQSLLSVCSFANFPKTTWRSLEHFQPLYEYFERDFQGDLTLSLPEPVMETFMVVLTPESVDENLFCDHPNETSPAAPPHGTICLAGSEKWNLGFFLNLHFGHHQEWKGQRCLNITIPWIRSALRPPAQPTGPSSATPQ